MDNKPMTQAMFSIGDRVRIVGNQSNWQGQLGTVRRILDLSNVYPILVLRDVEEFNELDRFHMTELELVHDEA